MATYKYEDGGFIIEDFDGAAPFCSFLPGLAGAYGVPLWSFYCNRGQGMCSFGIDNKENAIMEFFPANAAYQHVSMHGFRTYISTDKGTFEPFQPTREGNPKRTMKICPNSFSVTEENPGMDIIFTVTYFILPEENFPALIRRCGIKTISGQKTGVRLFDGMPQIMPYGVTTGAYKGMSNLQKSWAHVSGLQDNIAFYHLLTAPGDEAEVRGISGAYFYLSFTEDGRPIRPVTDPDLIFGNDVTFTLPADFPVIDSAPVNQTYVNKFSSAFTPLSFTLGGNETYKWNSFIGFAGNPESFAKRAASLCITSWLDEKEILAAKTADDITSAINTETASPLLDGYFKQSYLDNVLRGGAPYVLGDKIIHLFSRKHGDPERDYNYFSIAAEFFSQGNGNFRDVCQNRRSDVLFCPEAGEYNIRTFFSLIQADGFNPLEVRGATFSVRPENKEKLALLLGESEPSVPLTALCSGNFTAGQVINTIFRENVKLPDGGAVAFCIKILALCDQNIEAAFAEGYWIDHWTYLMDLIDSFTFRYPDKINELLFGSECRFFESPVKINARRDSYTLKNNILKQLNAHTRIKGKPESGWLKSADGKIYTVSLFAKMLSICVIKFASLDQEGCGLMMNGGKPGWNDAMNGLPALFGSGTGEAVELRRMLEFLNGIKDYGEVKIPEEAETLLSKIIEAQKISDGFAKWNAVCGEAEKYREKVLNGFSGKEASLSETYLSEILPLFIDILKKGEAKAVEIGGGLMPTYLTYEASGTDENGEPAGFNCKPLPYFLEGPVRQMKMADVNKRREIYNKIRSTDLYDKKIKMYRTSVSIEECGHNIGRIRSFSPGWLERESVFMHMEFKYLLEMVRGGLYEEFYDDIKALPPFMAPGVYGRSTLENSSFIASSNSPDPTIVGRGFVSRLSGSTAEVISMWKEMFAGGKIFDYSAEDGLSFTLRPKLAGWLFPENGEIRFTLFGKIPVTYINASRKNTYGANGVTVKKITVTDGGKDYVFDNGTVTGELAYRVRDALVSGITAEVK